MKKWNVIYLVVTGLFTAFTLMSASMYVFNYEEISKAFTSLGYPTHLIYPLAAAKVLGLIAIWTGKSKTLKEWAYAGFFFDGLLAAYSHLMVGDGQAAPAIVFMVLVVVSYVAGMKKVEQKAKEMAYA